MRLRFVLACGLAAFALFAAGAAAHATLITFDERPYAPVFPDDTSFSADPIGDFYDALGVDFDLAYLQPAFDDADYRSQYLVGAHGFSASFTDAVLPTYVSLVFGSPWFDFRATVTAYDASGNVVGVADSGGSFIGSVDPLRWDQTPYDPTTHANFHSASGIARLVFATELNPRTEAKFDNFYFGNVPAVAEPATGAMWAAGLGVMAATARRRKKRS